MKPNILHISWHDTGRHFGCYGVESVHTPNIDDLARTGVRFENAFCCAVMCSPSRGACLTGRYPQSNGLIHLCHGDWGHKLNPEEKHLSQLLRERGYYTAMHGFQHEVVHEDARERLGFQEFVNADPSPPTWLVPPCDVIADGAVEFLQRRGQQDGPFYLQMGFFETHRPYDFGGVEPDTEKGVTIPPHLVDNEASRTDYAALQGAIRKADAQVGRVLEALRQNGLEKNTLVIFAPDHGLAGPRAKATLYDPGLEIAFLMRWPFGGIEGGQISLRMISNVDLVPTIFDLCDWEKPLNLQGRSFANELGREDQYRGEPPRNHIFAMHHDGDLRCVRTRTHKLIRNFTKRRGLTVPVQLDAPAHSIVASNPPGKSGLPGVELYELSADPLEERNLADDPDFAEVRADLSDRLWRWMEYTDDPLLQGAYTNPRHHDHLAEYNDYVAANPVD
jgi:arylsulfatase A-like enzyme